MPVDELQLPAAIPEQAIHVSNPGHQHEGHHHHHNHHHHLRKHHATSAPHFVERSAKSAIDFRQGNESPVSSSGDSPSRSEHGRVKRYLTGLRKNGKSRKKLVHESEEAYVPTKGVNLRDVGAVTRGPMRELAVFRSSELLSKAEMKSHHIRTILDLRRMDRPCKAQKGNKASESTKTVIKYLLLGPQKLIPEKVLIPAHRAHPQPCPLCHEKAFQKYEADINVIHADLIPSTVGLRILQSMPWKVQLKTLFCACTGQGASSVMAPAVANDKLLGYRALYRTLLEDSKRGMAMAIRPFVDSDNYPILVHCIHGKDRTGLIIMLLLMLCNVDTEAIVDDYIMSETVLKESRMHKELHMDVYLTTDEVIAATKETMEDTITYVNEKYGGAAEYLKECGLEKEEIEAIIKNLMKEDDLIKAEPGLKPKFSLAESIQQLNPFRRRSSALEGKFSKAGGKVNKLGRLSERPELGHQKSSSLGDTPTDVRVLFVDGSSQGRSMRRASLATTSAAEIRARLNKLRSEHPELGPLSENEPIDFLSLSDQKPLPLGRASAGAVRSMDLDKELLPKTENRRLFSRKLKKTVSCPPLRDMPLRETRSVGSVTLGDSHPAEGAAALESPGRSPPAVGTVLHKELVTPFPERKAPLSPFDPQTEGKLAQQPPHHSAKGLQQDGIHQTATLTNGTL